MEILNKIADKSAIVGIIGLGYVGLPLGLEFANKNFKVIGFDLDDFKIKSLSKGKSYIKHISSDRIKKFFVDKKNFSATSDFSRLPEVDAIIICVPTPLNEHREPDMSFIENTAYTIQKYLRKGQLVSLESTTYPGTTEEILLPLFESAPKVQSGIIPFKVGKDFYLAFSPEREDPNNANYNTSTIPKVVGGITPNCLNAAQALYNQIIVKTVPVSSTRVAEATKILENVYRSVNIALMNELKMVFDRMGIDIWEVIEAATTKPFGYHPFYPGPGLGGHCIPIDPFYLSWKAKEYDFSTRFIELAGEVNEAMPAHVVQYVAIGLNQHKKAVNGSRILMLGMAYKKDIDDLRESPSLTVIELLRAQGADVLYNDPYFPKVGRGRRYNLNMTCTPLENLGQYDCVLIMTDHSDYNYQEIVDQSKLVVDSRNATKGIESPKIIRC